MLLDHVWIYLPIVFFVAVSLLQAFAATLFVDTPLFVAALYVWIIAFTLILASYPYYSRPFHAERFCVILSLAFLYAVLFHDYYVTLFASLPLALQNSALGVRLLYSATWLALATAILYYYLQNVGRAPPRLWPLAAFAALTLVFLPLEPTIFVSQQSAGLWVGRTTLTAFLFVLFTFGDAAGNVYHAYRRAHKMRANRAGEVIVTLKSIDIDARHTIMWSPMGTWPLFVHPVMLLAAIPYVTVLAYSVYVRWRVSTNAENLYLATEGVPNYHTLLTILRERGVILQLNTSTTSTATKKPADPTRLTAIRIDKSDSDDTDTATLNPPSPPPRKHKRRHRRHSHHRHGHHRKPPTSDSA